METEFEAAYVELPSAKVEIARLTNEIERLRAALQKIVELAHYPDESIARHALEQ
jgi:hypothetical protein